MLHTETALKTRIFTLGRKVLVRLRLQKPKPVITKHMLAGIFIGVAFATGLGMSMWVYNYLENQKQDFLEVTFVAPRQAVVFWKTDHETVGYVRYGESRYALDKQQEQTASTPSEIHAVVLEDIPLDGVYLTVHNQSDSFVRWREPIHITYDPTILE